MSRAPAFGGSRPATAGKAVRSVAETAASRLRSARPGEAVLERDRLALLRQLQAAVDRAGRLGEDARVRRPAAPAGRAAAAVEDRQLDVPLGRDARQLLLRAVDLPLRGEIAAVLARVRVADHHLEARGGDCDRGSPRRAGLPPAGRRSSRAAARPRAAAPASRASASASSTSSAVRVIETIRRSTACVPCLCLRGRRRRERCANAVVRSLDRRRVHAEVELGEMEAERARAGAEVREAAVGDPLAAVGAEQRVECVEIGHELAAVRDSRRLRAAPRSRRARRGTARRRRRPRAPGRSPSSTSPTPPRGRGLRLARRAPLGAQGR